MNRKNITHILITMLLIASIIAPATAQSKSEPKRRAPSARGASKEQTSAPPKSGKFTATEESEANRVARIKLQKKRLEKVPLVGIEFKNAVDYLREVSGLNILVNWSALEMEKEGIEDQEINVMLNDVTFEQALRAILEDAGGGEVQIDYVVKDGILTISTSERLAGIQTLEVYDMRDMIDWTEPEEMERFMGMLTSSVDRVSWFPNGHASICDTNGLLVVRNTLPNHEEIRKLLAKLRAVLATGAKRPISRRTRAKETRMQIKLVGDMKKTCFDPNAMGLIALGAISQEISRPPQEVIEELEDLLVKTKTLGLRNAIRLTLKDLYKQTNQPEKTLDLMRSMLSENDDTPLQLVPGGSRKFGEIHVETEREHSKEEGDEH